MTLRFTVLASGSRGNASLIQTDGFGVLLDGGLAAKELTNRLHLAGHAPSGVRGMLLTHTHTDHWNDSILGWLKRHQLPLFCHPSHHAVLARYSRHFEKLREAGLVRGYSPGEELALAPGLRCTPLPVRHDGGETFGFVLRGPADLFGSASSIGYVADLGTWDDALAQALADVDLLAVEFNHDVELERRSARPAVLIARVLGDEGHLSNDQASRFVEAVLARSAPGRLRHVVQLHLSQDCNRPELARKAARAALAACEFQVSVHTADQHKPGKVLRLEPGCARRRASRPREAWLPGVE
ncbi:MAG: MBL fold metallo-hydrolase [Gemmataceae bacterium]